MADVRNVLPAVAEYTLMEGAFAWPGVGILAGPRGLMEYARKELLAQCELHAIFQTEHGQVPTVELKLGRIARLQEVAQAVRREAYELLVGDKGVVIAAEHSAGLFYGIQSLLQLLSLQQSSHDGGPRVIHQCRCLDYPRFEWRGVLLDVGRHVFSVPFILKLLDLLAAHKLNKFHWHLTEDQGWRIEIKGLPRLTEIGAWRGTGEERYGGFYSQQDVKQVVTYAAERFIDVVPEIELPGHCKAALACYPELSCSGEATEVPMLWGVQTDVYCAGTEETFAFLETVLSEVLDMFPSEYIHLGGDECPKVRWAACAACQARMHAENIPDENHLQTWFIERAAHFVRRRGRTIIGWDEVLEGGIPEGAVVMGWRGSGGAVQAAKLGHNVIMCPNTRCYFDYRQSLDMRVMPGAAEPSFTPRDNSSSLSDMDLTLAPDMPALVTDASPENTPDHPRRHSTSPPASAAGGNTTELLAGALTETDADTDVLMRTETSPANSACTTLDVNASTAPLSTTPLSTAPLSTAPLSPPGLQAASSLRMHDVSSERHKGGGAGVFMPPSVAHPPSFCLHQVLDSATTDGAGGVGEFLWPQSAFEIVGASNGSPKCGDRGVAHEHLNFASHVPATSDAAAGDPAVAPGEAAASKELPLRASSAVLEHDIAMDAAVAVAEASAILPDLPPGAAFAVQLGAGQQQAVAHEVFPMTEADKANVLGGQANLWTEFIADEETAEYMLLPRLSAIAECLWSPLAQRSWQPFVRRAELMLDRCHRAGYTCRPMYDVSRA